MNFVRKIVSGQRIRTKEGDYDLDLTHITPRIIAMSFPAAKFWQKLYRNSIADVSNYLQERYGQNFWVYNMSGKEYDTAPFHGQVLTASWEDHHSPTLNLLVECCQSIHAFLQAATENVIIVHCNAGKGRTGTLICCYLLFCGFCQTAEQALAYYGIKRFTSGLGVTQPSQVRYVYYFEQSLRGQVASPCSVRLNSVRVKKLPAIKRAFRIQV